MLILLSIGILVATGALSNQLDMRNEHVVRVYPRQTTNCTNQCAPIMAATQCPTSQCLCPILNSAGSTAINACVNCITLTEPQLANNIEIVASLCAKCENQCSSALTAFIPCISSQCTCTVFVTLDETTITSCSNCFQSFDPTLAQSLIEFAQSCGVIPNVTTPSISAATRVGLDEVESLAWIYLSVSTFLFAWAYVL